MRSRYMQILRAVIQWGFVLFCLYLGIRFALFVSAIRTGMLPTVSRPNGVEAFLPIAGLLGLRDWLSQGTLNPVHPAATIIFLAVVGISFFLRRSFCSWICPVGTFSELLWKRGFALFRRNLKAPAWLDLPLRGLKYLLLLFFLWQILFRMPAQAVSAFITSDYSKIADVRMLDFFLHMSLLGGGIILFLVLLSLPVRNAFCRYLCPYGALLGLAGWFSPVAVTRLTSNCVQCGVCTQVCPSYIPVMAKERVHSPECIGCWRCVSHCRAEGALEMMLPGRKIIVSGIVFALLVVGLFWGSTIMARLTGHWQSSVTITDYMRLIGR
jgi:polyferredoxin